MSDINRIKDSLQVLCGTFGRRMDANTLLVWARELEKYAGERLWNAFKTSLMGESMPTLRWLIENASNGLKSNAYKEPHALTDREKKLSDNAAVMSMLWLRYNHGHQNLGYLMLNRMFGGDSQKAVDAAQQIYTKEMVDQWMIDQKKCGN